MLKDRIITALILGIALLCVLFWLPSPLAILTLGLATALGGWEWAGLGGILGAAGRAAYAGLITASAFGVWQWSRDPGHALIIYVCACAWWLLALLWLAWFPDFRPPKLVLACGLLVLVPSFVAISAVFCAATGSVRGAQGVLWLLIWVYSADVGAYFAGRAFGRTKLAPRVSPSKTWEGVGGGIVLSLVAAAAGAAWFGLSMLPTLAFGLLLVCVSIVGDLTESMFKRGAGLKDSGTLLPGHGGVLDRIDSVTAAAPLYALGLYGLGAMP